MTKVARNNEKGKPLEQRVSKMTLKKHFSQTLAYKLYYAPKLYKDPKVITSMAKAYRNTMYCSNDLSVKRTETGKVAFHSKKRCKNRWCPTCQSIRIAKLINGYGPQLDKLDDLYFVTLTAPTVVGDELGNRIQHFQKVWRNITSSMYWKENKPKGLRKAECTLRDEGKYHYHFHVLIQGKENAEWLRDAWLKRIPAANIKAQDVRKVRSGEYLELFKYFTKLISQDKTTGKRYIDASRLDFVMMMMRGKRVFQPFGGLKMVDEDSISEYEEFSLPEIYLGTMWSWVLNTGYVNNETKDPLLKRKLKEWVQELLGKITKEDEREVKYGLTFEYYARVMNMSVENLWRYLQGQSRRDKLDSTNYNQDNT